MQNIWNGLQKVEMACSRPILGVRRSFKWQKSQKNTYRLHYCVVMVWFLVSYGLFYLYYDNSESDNSGNFWFGLSPRPISMESRLVGLTDAMEQTNCIDSSMQFSWLSSELCVLVSIESDVSSNLTSKTSLLLYVATNSLDLLLAFNWPYELPWPSPEAPLSYSPLPSQLSSRYCIRVFP
jgi:hypothetical protein